MKCLAAQSKRTSHYRMSTPVPPIVMPPVEGQTQVKSILRWCQLWSPSPELDNVSPFAAQVVYHVYQMGAPEAGINFGSASCNIKALFKPLLLFLMFGVWVIYIAGVSYVSIGRLSKAKYNLRMPLLTPHNLLPLVLEYVEPEQLQ